jgi:hypothetical protein
MKFIAIREIRVAYKFEFECPMPDCGPDEENEGCEEELAYEYFRDHFEDSDFPEEIYLGVVERPDEEVIALKANYDRDTVVVKKATEQP